MILCEVNLKLDSTGNNPNHVAKNGVVYWKDCKRYIDPALDNKITKKKKQKKNKKTFNYII